MLNLSERQSEAQIQSTLSECKHWLTNQLIVIPLGYDEMFSY